MTSTDFGTKAIAFSVFSTRMAQLCEADGNWPKARQRLQTLVNQLVTMLEAKRARAYRTGDVDLLATAYASGSPTGRRALALLHGLVSAGQRAAGLQAFVEAVQRESLK